MFIILSESQYINKKSVPRACQINENKIALSIFTTYESAVEFCKADGYIAEGEYLIGRIDNSDKFRDLYSILNTAAYLGINCSDIDCGTEDAMNVKLTAFFEWGNRKVSNISILFPQENIEKVIVDGKVGINFNYMLLYNPNKL